VFRKRSKTNCMVKRNIVIKAEHKRMTMFDKKKRMTMSGWRTQWSLSMCIIFVQIFTIQFFLFVQLDIVLHNYVELSGILVNYNLLNDLAFVKIDPNFLKMLVIFCHNVTFETKFARVIFYELWVFLPVIKTQ